MPITVAGTTITFNDSTTQSTAAVVSTSTVLNATAGLTAGAVGSYVEGCQQSVSGTNTYTYGSNYANVGAFAHRYTDTCGWVSPVGQQGGTLSGTWKYLGPTNTVTGTGKLTVSLYVRVA